MAKHVQAPPKPPSVLKPGLDMRLEEVILKSLSKRPEERYQTGQEFDEAMAKVADRLTPGWQRSLEPGADLSKMVPGTPASLPSGALPSMAMPTGSPPPIQAIYNPTPPVKPVAKKAASTGCMGVLLLCAGFASAAITLAALIH
jgi:hypothetical protein